VVLDRPSVQAGRHPLIFRAEAWGDKVRLVTWVQERMTHPLAAGGGAMAPFEVIAVVKDAQIKGAFVYTNYTGTSVDIHAAGEAGWLTKQSLRGFFDFPFVQLKCRRVTAMVHRKNKRARDACERLGFKFEGVCRHWYLNGDGIIYGMTRGDCRWIEPAPVSRHKFNGREAVTWAS
jgi:hypothetical protein